MGNLMGMLKRHEGLKLTRYKCPTGHITIGYGHNLEAKPLNLPETITEKEAEHILVEDILDCEQDLYSISWFNNLDEVRQDVLIDMVFNLGFAGLLKFKNTLGYIKEGKYEEAAENMLKSKWATQVGDRAVELAYMMKSGAYRS